MANWLDGICNQEGRWNYSVGISEHLGAGTHAGSDQTDGCRVSSKIWFAIAVLGSCACHADWIGGRNGIFGSDRRNNSAEVQAIARDAYVYAYSPVYAYRFLQDEVFNSKSNSYIGAFNKIRNYQRLNTPEDTMFTPNVDTPYTRIWLDLRAEPVVLTLPKITPDEPLLRDAGYQSRSLQSGFHRHTNGRPGRRVDCLCWPALFRADPGRCWPHCRIADRLRLSAGANLRLRP